MRTSLKLNLGCGDNVLPGYLNVDQEGQPDLRCNLAEFPWIWADNSVEEVRLNYLLAELPETPDIYLTTLQELYRICQPDATIQLMILDSHQTDGSTPPTTVQSASLEGLLLVPHLKNWEGVEHVMAHSPLKGVLGIQFELTDCQCWLAPLAHPQSGEISDAEQGETTWQFNQSAKAIQLTLRVIKPSLYQQAASFLAIGNYEQAIAAYEHCIEIHPEDRTHYWHLGIAWLLQGDPLSAQAIWFSVLSDLPPEDTDFYIAELLETLATVAREHRQRGAIEQAEQLYRQILEQQPNHQEALQNLSQLLIQQNQLDAAITCYQQRLSLTPANAALHNNLGVLFKQQGNVDAAIACYHQALELDPNNAAFHNNLGEALFKQGQTEAAIVCYQRALHFNPDSVEANYNLASAWVEKGQLTDAIAQYTRVIDLQPDHVLSRWNRALFLLTLGDLQQGFAEYEWRWQRAATPPRLLSQPVWDGADLTGRTILLHAEQGFGDTLQFIRYALLVAQRGGRVIVECQAPLLRLLQSIGGVHQWIVAEAPLPDGVDVHAPLLSLPYIFGTTLATIPAAIPYLYPPQSPHPVLMVPDDTRLKVGIVWSGSPSRASNESRSCPLEHFQLLFSIPDIAFYSLQMGDSITDLNRLPSSVCLQDLSGQLTDFADTAGAIAQLDLVITVDTAVAHLAGALGCSTWILLSQPADWRWLLDRNDSPWYPTARLFRQPTSGDWNSVIANVATALEHLLLARRTAH